MKSKLLILTDISNFSDSPLQCFCFCFFLQFSAYNYHKIQTNIGEKKLSLGCGEEEDFVCDSSIPGTV